MLTTWLVADSKSLQCITGYLGIVANVANDKVATDAFCLSFNYSFMIYVFSTFIADSYVISYSFKFATPAPNGPSFHESFEISSETRHRAGFFNGHVSLQRLEEGKGDASG